MAQQQYQEDSLGALDIGKEFAKSYLLPWERMKYDPSVWNISRGGINVNKLNPLRGNSLVAGIAKTGRSAFNATTKNWGWVNRARGSETAKGIRESISKIRGTNLEFDTGIIQGKDGILSMSKAKFKDMGWHKSLLEKEKNLMYQLNNNSKTKYNKAFDAIDDLISKTSDETKIQKLYKAQSGILDSLNRGSDSLAVPTKANKSQRFLSRISSFKGVTTTNEAKIAGKLWGTRRLAQAGRIGMGAARIGARAASVAGWGLAMYEVGSLMYQGVNMVANPIAQAGVRAVDQAFSSMASLGNPELGGQLELGFLSQGAATERQRAVQAISKSRINGRSMLGNEGAMMHR